MKLKVVLYILFWILFIAHQVIQKGYNIHIVFIHSYLDDFLLFPILMPFLQQVHAFFTEKQILPVPMIVMVFLSMTLMVEFVFPRVSNRFTFDWWDFLAYGLGMILFLLVYNREKKE